MREIGHCGRRAAVVVGTFTVAGAALTGCGVAIVSSPTDAVTATTSPPVKPPSTLAESATNAVTQDSVADTTPPPPDGYPPSVLGEIDATSTRLTVRPVAQCRFGGGLRAPEGDEIVAPLPSTASDCLLGPPYATGRDFSDATAHFDGGTGTWVIDMEMTPDGLAAFNQLAAMCYSAEPTCPSQQIAIVFDYVVVSAPLVRIDNFESTIQMTGAFDEDEATEIADTINQGG